MTDSNDVKASLEGLGKFTIQEEIQEGANAIATFRAFDCLLEGDVFLKVVYYRGCSRAPV